MEKFKSVGVTGRQGQAEVNDTLQRLLSFLAKRDIAIFLDEQLENLLPGYEYQICKRVEMGVCCDLVVVVGGDGSLLGAARDLVDYGLPIIGVNRGRLGFLTDICPSELGLQLSDVLEGRYGEESRFLLNAEIVRDGQQIGKGVALNDVVLHPGESTRIIEFELFIDDVFVYKQRSDGLIVATPTGSTAYALSGGGPIMHPSMDAIVLVPMHPHMLTNRPLLIGGNSQIKLIVSRNNSLFPQINCDGQVHIASAPGDEIIIKKKPNKLKLIHPSNHNFYKACRSKLRWNYQEYSR